MKMSREIKFRAWDNWQKEDPFANIGYKDKSGVEIFEGDVVKLKDYLGDCKDDEIVCVIVFYESRCQFLPQEVQENHKGGKYIHQWDVATGVEIIGNIHQHPELLNGDDNAKEA